MLGLNVKRGVATTLERVHKAAGFEFGKLEVLWSGTTAGIIFERTDVRCDVKLVFPSINELADIPQEMFNNLIGYALHELGHAWYTENRPWDLARKNKGDFVSKLINGLEDPRIERLVIESGRAPNASVLFEKLINSLLKRDGYVKPDDKANIPFLLAVEGRRLNGYQIDVPSIVNASPWAAHIKWALKKARAANDTKTIVKIAIELAERIKTEQPKQPEQPEPPEQGKQQDEPSDEGDEGNGGNEGDGGDGGDGEPSDGKGDGKGDESSDGEPSDEGDGETSEGEPASGGGYSNGEREVEPSDFIESELGKHAKVDDSLVHRPAVGKPSYSKFTWS